MLAKAAIRTVANSIWTVSIAALALSGATARAQEAAKPPITADSSALAKAQAAMATPHPGKAVYEQSCAACHNHPEATRAPALDTLKAMRYQTILYALNE